MAARLLFVRVPVPLGVATTRWIRFSRAIVVIADTTKSRSSLQLHASGLAVSSHTRPFSKVPVSNLIDTAELYPIPSDGGTEQVIGDWMQSRKVARDKVVIATKIAGGRLITPQSIEKNCSASLKRLNTDYIDVYQLHWPQHYSPQFNWGQSLAYDIDVDASAYWHGHDGPTTHEALGKAMHGLVKDGKIHGWGLCNDNAYGLTACTRTAKALRCTPPCSIQGDFSLIDRKSEENGVAEAASRFNENVGFISYNALAGGMLTGKYINVPTALDDVNNRDRARQSLQSPRGRIDTRSWGCTLYRYRTEAAQDAIREYAKLAKQHGMSSAELALRWNRQRRLVTTTLVGHTSMEQLQDSIKFFGGKDLRDDLMWEIDRVHMRNRLPIFSNPHVGRDWYGAGEIGEPIP